MSTKKINAGDTLTVGDLTDDYLGAVIEVGPVDGFTTSLELKLVSAHAPIRNLWSMEGGFKNFRLHDPVTVITPPQVVQPDEPTVRGQIFRVEGMPSVYGFRVSPNAYGDKGFWWRSPSCFWRWDSWDQIKECVGERQIIVSDLPCWPDETPEVPERIEVGEWPDDDTHLRGWEWHTVDDRFGNDHTARWNDQESQWECLLCDTAWRRGGQRKYAWTRGERVK